MAKETGLLLNIAAENSLESRDSLWEGYSELSLHSCSFPVKRHVSMVVVQDIHVSEISGVMTENMSEIFDLLREIRFVRGQVSRENPIYDSFVVYILQREIRRENWNVPDFIKPQPISRYTFGTT